MLEIKAERRGLLVRNCSPQFRHAALLLFTMSYCAVIETELRVGKEKLFVMIIRPRWLDCFEGCIHLRNSTWPEHTLCRPNLDMK